LPEAFLLVSERRRGFWSFSPGGSLWAAYGNSVRTIARNQSLFSEAGGAAELETYDLLWNMSTEVGNVADSSKGGGMSDGIE